MVVTSPRRPGTKCSLARCGIEGRFFKKGSGIQERRERYGARSSNATASPLPDDGAIQASNQPGSAMGWLSVP